MTLFLAVAARKLCGWAWQFAVSSLAKLLCIAPLPHRRLITLDNQRVIGKEYDSGFKAGLPQLHGEKRR
ncbi:hypothetical protein [uncultured Marinobacter sp.]|uniref:hypothetical protein n=1 Tax=uncultured Marinobacter sp. TaxID=187379 RepID=UPI0030DA53DC|tara:strand:+ start:377 stop:583 length:207 start_codon:yes stop_codon:yes gene_type:complete